MKIGKYEFKDQATAEAKNKSLRSRYRRRW
jgi:hypothetical protein